MSRRYAAVLGSKKNSSGGGGTNSKYTKFVTMVGNAINTTSDSAARVSRSSIWKYDAANYDGSPVFRLIANGKAASGKTLTVYLYDRTAAALVTGVTVSTTNTSNAFMRGPTFVPVDGHEYEIWDSGSGSQVRDAWIAITQEGGVDTETVLTISNGTRNTTSTTYADIAGQVIWQNTLFDGTVTVYLEGVLRTTSGATGYLELRQTSGTPVSVSGSEISYSGTSAGRVRSGALTLTAGATYIVRAKTGGSGTVYVDDARLVVKQVGATKTVTYIGLGVIRNTTAASLNTGQQFVWESDDFANLTSPTCNFEVDHGQSGGGTGTAILNDGSTNVFSQTVTTGTAELDKASFTPADGKTYTLYLGSSSTSYTHFLQQGRFIYDYGISTFTADPLAVTSEVSPLSGEKPLVVSCSAVATGGAEGAKTWKWEWRPSGGSTWTQFATTQTASLTLSDAGSFEVKVTVTDTAPTSVSTTKVVVVTNPATSAHSYIVDDAWYTQLQAALPAASNPSVHTITTNWKVLPDGTLRVQGGATVPSANKSTFDTPWGATFTVYTNLRVTGSVIGQIVGARNVIFRNLVIDNRSTAAVDGIRFLSAKDGTKTAVPVNIGFENCTIRGSMGSFPKLTWLGDSGPSFQWSSTYAYQQHDITSYNSLAYRALSNVPVGTLPTNTTYWAVVPQNIAGWGMRFSAHLYGKLTYATAADWDTDGTAANRPRAKRIWAKNTIIEWWGVDGIQGHAWDEFIMDNCQVGPNTCRLPMDRIGDGAGGRIDHYGMHADGLQSGCVRGLYMKDSRFSSNETVPLGNQNYNVILCAGDAWATGSIIGFWGNCDFRNGGQRQHINGSPNNAGVGFGWTQKPDTTSFKSGGGVVWLQQCNANSNSANDPAFDVTLFGTTAAAAANCTAVIDRCSIKKLADNDGGTDYAFPSDQVFLAGNSIATNASAYTQRTSIVVVGDCTISGTRLVTAGSPVTFTLDGLEAGVFVDWDFGLGDNCLLKGQTGSTATYTFPSTVVGGVLVTATVKKSNKAPRVKYYTVYFTDAADTDQYDEPPRSSATTLWPQKLSPRSYGEWQAYAASGYSIYLSGGSGQQYQRGGHWYHPDVAYISHDALSGPFMVKNLGRITKHCVAKGVRPISGYCSAGDPVDPNRVICIGYSEVPINPEQDYNGIYFSTDGGKTFTHRKAIATSNGAQDALGGNDRMFKSVICYDPTTKGASRAEVWYAGVILDEQQDDRGIFRSTNGGLDWTRTLLTTAAHGFPQCLKADSLGNIYWAGSKGLFWCSKAGAGASLSALGNLPAGKPIMSFDIGQNDVMWAVVSTTGGTAGTLTPTGMKLYKSENRGQQWTEYTLPNSKQPVYVAACPTVENRVFVLAVDTAFYTTNGGNDWIEAVEAPGSLWGNSILYSGATGLRHSRNYQSGVLWHPTNPAVLYGQFNTVHAYSHDGGATWRRGAGWNGYESKRSNDGIAFSYTDKNCFGYACIDVGFIATTNGGQYFNVKATPPAGTAGEAKWGNAAAVVNSNYMLFVDEDTVPRIHRYWNGTWQYSVATAAAAPKCLYIAVARDDTTKVWCGTKYSNNSGAAGSWTDIATLTNNGAKVRGMCEGSGSKAIWAIATRKIYRLDRSTNPNNTTWGLFATAPADIDSRVFAAHPTNPNICYVQYSDDLYKCEGGVFTSLGVKAKYNALAGRTTIGGIASVAVDPRYPDRIVCGMYDSGGPGILETRNGGQSWDDISGDIPRSSWLKVKISPMTGDIFIHRDFGCHVLPAYYDDANSLKNSPYVLQDLSAYA